MTPRWPPQSCRGYTALPSRRTNPGRLIVVTFTYGCRKTSSVGSHLLKGSYEVQAFYCSKSELHFNLLHPLPVFLFTPQPAVHCCMCVVGKKKQFPSLLLHYKLSPPKDTQKTICFLCLIYTEMKYMLHLISVHCTASHHPVHCHVWNVCVLYTSNKVCLKKKSGGAMLP